MKKNLFYLLMLVCSISLFSACSDDDESLPISQDLSGNYKGTLSVSLVGTPIESSQNVTLGEAGDNAVALEIKKLEILGITIEHILVNNCPVSKQGDTYVFSGEQTLDLSDKGLGQCPLKIVEGKVTNGKLSLKLEVKTTVPAPLTVGVSFEGSKLKGTESSAAVIKSFTIDSEVITGAPVIYQEDGKIIFSVKDDATAEDLKAIVPTIEISEKATITPAIGTPVDFSGKKTVIYTVVAEDGTVKKYVAYAANAMKFSFDEWISVGEGAGKHDEPMPKDQLASSVEGASLLFLFGVEGFPVYKTDDKVSGDAAIKLVTMDTREQANALVPALVAGSVFTGEFQLDFAFTDKLSCTRFGIPYNKEPLHFKGMYKYTPGVNFIDGTDVHNIVEVKGKLDECSIQAVLYKVEKDDEVLTGHDLNSSDKRVAVAQLTDGTEKKEYTSFDIPFTYFPGKSYEAGAKYKLAIVCSSSKEGDFFKGAGGSTLFLDELEVVGQ